MNYVDGTAYFTEGTQNLGLIRDAVFSDTATNAGIVSSTAVFTGTAINNGQTNTATFYDSTINDVNGKTVNATFIANTENRGVVGSASFSGSAKNTETATVTGNASFTNNTSNLGIIQGNVTFVNTASNAGVIQGNADFRGTASNTGSIEGNAIFLGNTSNSGTVSGTAYVASTVSNTGQVTGPVTVHYAPSFTPSPTATYVYMITGLNDTFYTRASGTDVENFVYTWYKDNVIIPNVTTINYQPTEVGTYKVYIENSWGEYVESPSVEVRGLGGRTYIVTQPVNTTSHNLQVTLSAEVQGSGTISTQWYESNVAIPGATTDSLVVDSVSGNYKYVASTNFEAVTSNTATVQLTAINSFYSAKFLGANAITKAATLNHTLSSNDFTIEAWVKTSTNTGYKYIVGVGAPDVATTGWVLYVEWNGNLTFISDGMGWVVENSLGYSANQKLTLNKWHHVAVTRSSNNIRLFLDGTIVQEKSFTGIIATNYSQIRCGQWGYQTSTGIKVTDLRIIKGQALYESNFVVPYAKLTSTGFGFDSYYHNKLINVNQNITGTILELDLQNNTFNSSWTKIGKPIITADSNWYLDDVALKNQFSGIGDDIQGKDGVNYFGGYVQVLDGYIQGYYPHRYLWYLGDSGDPEWTFATSVQNGLSLVFSSRNYSNAVTSTGDLIFDNTLYNIESGQVVSTAPVSAAGIFSKVFDTGKYIKTRLSRALNAGDFTFEAFAKIDTSTAGDYNLLSIGKSDESNAWGGFRIHYVDGVVKSFINDGEGGILTGSSLVVNAWYHIAVVRSGTTVTLYVNGIKLSQITSSYSITKQNITIGTNDYNLNTGYAWKGNITNIRVSRVARYSGDYFDSEFTPFITDSNTLLLTLQTNSLEGYNTPTGTVSSSPLSPWYLDKAAANSSFTGTGDGVTQGQYGYIYNNGVAVNHPYYYNTYWTTQQTIENGITLYTERHANTVAASVVLQTDGDQLINTNASGVLSATSLTRSVYSRYFNGTSFASLNDPTKLDFNSSGLTIEFWVKFKRVDGQRVLFTRNGGPGSWGSNGHQYVGFLSNNVFYFQYAYVANGSIPVSMLTSTITVNTWTHIAVSFDGSTTRLYKDGVLQSTSYIAWYSQPSLTTVFFGKNSNSDANTFFDGWLSQFRFTRGQALYVEPTFVIPNAPLTETGYNNISQNITGNITFNAFQTQSLESGINTTGLVVSSTDSPLTVKDIANALQYTGYGNDTIGKLNYYYNTGVETHHPYYVFGTKFIDVSSVNLLSNGDKLYTNFYSITASSANTFVYGGLSAYITNLSGELAAITPTTHVSRYFENGVNTGGQHSQYYLPSADLSFGTSDFTVEFWAKQTSKPDAYNRTFVFSNASTTLTLNAGHTTWGTNKYSFEAWKGGATQGIPGTQTNYWNSITNETLVYDRWRHYAICKQGTNIYLYIDGLLKPEATITVDDRSFTMTEGYFGYIYGFATNLRIIKGQALYTTNFNVPSAELTNTGYGNVNQNITGVVTRYLQSTSVESGCTNVRSVTSSESPFYNYKTYGVNLNGNAQKIHTYFTSINTSDFTQELFVNIKKLSNNQNIMEYPIMIGHYTNGKIGMYNRASDAVAYTSENVVQVGQWMHLAVVRNSNTTTLYVNGSAAAVGVGSEWTSNLTNTIGFIGTFIDNPNYTYALNGAVSNVRLIKNQALYTTNFNTPSADLTATGYGNVNQGITGDILLLGVNQPAYKTNSKMFRFINSPEPYLIDLF